MPAMPSERSRRGKLPQLVSHHVFRDVDRNKTLAVMHSNGMSDQFRKNYRTARPGANNALFHTTIHRRDFLQQFTVDERALSEGTSHVTLLCL